MKNELVIKKKDVLKGNDGCKVFSVRIKNETVDQLEDISSKTNRSRNEIINILLDYALEHCKIEEN